MKTSKLLIISLAAAFVLATAACNIPVVTETEDLEKTLATEPVLEAGETALMDDTENIAAEEEATSGTSEQDQETTTPAEQEDTQIESAAEEDEIAQSAVLSQEEIDHLVYMREEEKLARDVYLALYDVWDLNIFQNIASSEQKHTDSVKTLLNTYGLPDIVADDTPGIFENDELQALYYDLVERGSQSLGEALLVGGLIEELDILDLQEAIAETDQADIIRVYENLTKGSYNHLRAFVTNYESQTGETYKVQLMTQEEIDTILTSGSAGNRGRR